MQRYYKFYKKRQLPLLFFIKLNFSIAPTHSPPSQHGEIVEGVCSIFLNRHRHTNRHPALGLIRWDTDRFIGRNPCQPTHVLDIRLSEILIGRRPLTDNLPDRIEPILMIIRTCEQVESSSSTILQTLKLAKSRICLLGS